MAMAFPGSGVETLYRNNINEVQKYIYIGQLVSEEKTLK